MPVVVRPVDSDFSSGRWNTEKAGGRRRKAHGEIRSNRGQLPKKAASSDTEDGLTFCRPEKSRQGSAWRRNSWPGLIRRLVEQQALSRWTIWDRMGETSICLVNGWECCSHGLTCVFSICLYFHFLTWFAVSHIPASPVANWDSTVF